MTESHTPTHVIIHIKFKQYRREIRQVWETYSFLEFYLPYLHKSIKIGTVPEFTIPKLHTSGSDIVDKKNTYGILKSMLDKTNARRAIIEALSIFEDFIATLVKLTYRDYPQKISMPNNSIDETFLRKLLKMIVESTNREEVIEKLIEERVRGLFYGKPADIFLKDAARLELDDFFKVTAQETIKTFEEIVARRNIIIHNDGRTDSKYLREVSSCTLPLKRSYQSFRFMFELP